MTDPFERITGEAMRACGITDTSRRVVLGLSGGADSVALLFALASLGYEVVAAHCNFNLRGEESLRDRNHAFAMVREAGARWEETSFDTLGYAHANGLCLEDACRRLRYEWFEELRERTGAAAIAVAHHRDDQAETFFINLLRSAGASGLRGMKLCSGHIVRPMLGVSRREVLDYLKRKGKSAVTDSSNLADDFLRNRIRHHVIPALRDAAGSVDADAAVARSMVYLGENADLLELLAARAATAYRRDGGLDVAALAAAEPMAQAFLYQLLRSEGFRRDTTDSIIASAAGSGKIFTASGRRWLLDRGVLRPYREAGPADSVAASRLRDIPGLSVAYVENPCYDPTRLYLDPSADDEDACWELRLWRRGDRIEPFGMRGSRLVSDLLSDRHMALDEKERVRVLTRNGTVLWVAGIRASRHFPVAGPAALEVTADF